jgi:glycosyltransferase involved in cell wall biosynthesis
MYEPFCSGKMFRWPAGIDVDSFDDLSKTIKKYDFLIYDKIRWYREIEVDRVLQRIINHLEKNGLTYRCIRYGHHHYKEFIQGLEESKSMIFICEHETQGLACQEALASNIPVLAWDEGELVDPELKALSPEKLAVSSVPYFSEECGMRFKIDEFENTCDKFIEGNYKPKVFIEKNLSLLELGNAYVDRYFSLVNKY